MIDREKEKIVNLRCGQLRHSVLHTTSIIRHAGENYNHLFSRNYQLRSNTTTTTASQ